MNLWRGMPKAARLYLVVAVYLGMCLILLALARISRLPVSLDDIQAFFRKTTMTPELTVSAQFPASAATATFPPGVAWLRVNSSAPILSEPDDRSPVLAILDAGQTVQVIGVSPDRQYWAVAVPYYETGHGWVPAYLTLVQNPEAAPEMVETDLGIRATDQMPVLEMTTNVNVRQLPNIDSLRLDVLKPGVVIPAIGLSEDGYWYAVKLLDGRTGWVSKDYVTATNVDVLPVITISPASLGTMMPSPEPGKPYLVASVTVNLRAGPGREYQVVGTLEQYMMAAVQGKSSDGKWWAVGFNGTQNGRAWVAGEYVQVTYGELAPVIP